MADAITPATERGLIPIVLGVVGHRDLPNDAETLTKLESALLAVFQEFEEAYPDSPKVLLSPLAPGADQQAAEVALRLPKWSVRAPLPFEPEAFLQSTAFQDKNKAPDVAGQKRFAELQNHSRVEWFVVPMPPERRPANGDWARIARGQLGESDADRNLRRACYANPGGYIVRHCQTLIALWDGDTECTKPSGTAEIVRFKLGGVAPSLYPRTADEPLGFDSDRGPVIVLHTPRAATKADPSALGARTVRVPAKADNMPYGEKIPISQVARRKSRPKRFGERIKHALGIEKGQEEYDLFLSICQTIDDFNREARLIPDDEVVWGKRFADRLKAVEKDVVEIFPDSDPLEPQCPTLRSRYRHILQVREAAGHLTGRLAPIHGRAGLALFIFLFLALLSFHFYAHPIGREAAGHHAHSPLLLAVFGAVWFVLAGLVVWAWWVRLDDRRLDYRALAEALRVRRAWAQAGIGRSVSSSYLGQLRSEVVWVRRALQHLCPPPEFWERQFDRLDDDRKAARLQICTRWVQEQEKQHAKGTKKEHKKAFGFRAVGFCFALSGLIVLGCLWTNPSDPVPLVLVAGSLLIILGGLLIAICERRAHEELSKQYERMHMIFRSGSRELAAALNPADPLRARTILAELGREAIQENAQWLILRRSRPLELPLGA